MRLVILTSNRRGSASRCLPLLCSNPDLRVAGVILSRNVISANSSAVKRKIKKAARIGVLGALNGIRLREWFADKTAKDLGEVCDSCNLEIAETDYINSEKTKELLRHYQADLGLSLGNGYIQSSVFSIPKYGTINLHTEILPRFQGAYGIIWPIYENMGETGFTVHQMDNHIDTGPILFREKRPIEFRRTLRETVEYNLEKTRQLAPQSVEYVCLIYEHLRSNAEEQEMGTHYTTRSFRQYLRMIRNHKKMALSGTTSYINNT